MAIDLASIDRAEAAVDSALSESTNLETSCQAFAEAVYGQFAESIALARTFAVLPFSQQPPGNSDFARGISNSQAVPLTDETPVLTLLGTYGQQPEWCERKRSAGHLAIPLLSSDVVATIPMLARLLDELGLGLDWVDRPGEMNISKVGRLSGIFYVQDATTAKDARGRLIIPDQEFVSSYGVRTVFGSAMMLDVRTFLVNIVFATETVPRRTTAAFLELATQLGVRGSRCKARGLLFDGSP